MKTINIMIFVVSDIDGIKKTVKDLKLINLEKLLNLSFFLPKHTKLYLSLLNVQKKFIGMI